jgi:hypothetical protein
VKAAVQAAIEGALRDGLELPPEHDRHRPAVIWGKPYIWMLNASGRHTLVPVVLP